MLSYGDWGNVIKVYHEGHNDHNMSWAEFDFSGNLVAESKKGPFFPGLTAEEISEATEAIKKMQPAPYQNVYLRFGDIPVGGKSKNYATGEMESGVSCYALRWDLISQSYRRTGGGLAGAMIVYMIKGAPMYFIAGEECGTGSDGEPLLDNPVVLATARYDMDKDGYVIKERIERK